MMGLVDKYLGEETIKEAKKDERSALKSWDDGDNLEVLRDSYYDLSDNMWNFVAKLNSLNGETGVFTQDLKNAKQMYNFFKKLTIGKYI